MKFRILLWMLSRLLIKASKKNETFQKQASLYDSVFQLKTQDNGIGRRYSINKGHISTSSTLCKESDLDITFKNADYGFSVLTSKDKNAFTDGVSIGEITIEGDFKLLIWFQNLVNTMKSKGPEVPSHLKRVGFVGAGFIGAPMIRTLLRKGHRVIAFDKNPEALEKIAQDGATGASSMDDLKDSQVIIIMVNTMDQVRDVVYKLGEILPMASDIPLVIMSTVSPDGIAEVRSRLNEMGRKDIDIMDAPVSGAPINAEAGKLAIMAGGGENVYTRVKPVLESLGENVFFMGPLGSGCAMKLVNNILGISIGLNVNEALRLGIEKKLDPDYMVQVINASSGKNFFTEKWPFTKMMFQMVLQDSTYHAKSALFSTGVKDLVTAFEWAAKSHFKLASAENAIKQINDMSEEDFVSGLKSILKPIREPRLEI